MARRRLDVLKMPELRLGPAQPRSSAPRAVLMTLSTWDPRGIGGRYPGCVPKSGKSVPRRAMSSTLTFSKLVSDQPDEGEGGGEAKRGEEPDAELQATSRPVSPSV